MEIILAEKLSGIGLDEISILYRTNAQSRIIEDILRRNSIPYQIIGSIKFYDRKEIKDLIAFLRLISNDKDEISFNRVVNFPPRGIGAKSIEKINKFVISASKTKQLKNILTTNNLPLVSIDFNHNSSSSVFDLTQTQVINQKFCRVLSWYDNEWGFSNRMIDTMLDFKKFL